MGVGSQPGIRRPSGPPKAAPFLTFDDERVMNAEERERRRLAKTEGLGSTIKTNQRDYTGRTQ